MTNANKITFVLQKAANGFPGTYSLESGLADNVRHFDHHKEEHRHYPSPSNNPEIPVIKSGEIQISHIDADTFIGALRMTGGKLPEIDLDLVEQIDLNGSSVVQDKFDLTLLYMVGVGVKARQLGFPRVSDEPQDVTEIMEFLMSTTQEEFIELGRASQEKAEQSYVGCRHKMESPKVGMWVVDISDNFDPSRPYEDGTAVVVVFRKHYKTISIYCDPESEYQFGGETLVGIPFAGHPKACGSPRGQGMTLEDAEKVYDRVLQIVWDMEIVDLV